MWQKWHRSADRSAVGVATHAALTMPRRARAASCPPDIRCEISPSRPVTSTTGVQRPGGRHPVPLDVIAGARTYDPAGAGVPDEFAQRVGPPVAVKLLDPRLLGSTPLSPQAFDDLVNFVRDGLYDPRVNARSLCQLVPSTVPSGMPVLQFEACR